MVKSSIRSHDLEEFMERNRIRNESRKERQKGMKRKDENKGKKYKDAMG